MIELVRGVGWLGDEPVVALTDPMSGELRSLPLTGAVLRYRAVDAPGVLWCTGRRGDDGRTVACPRGLRASTGTHCEECAAADPFRFVHIVHRQNFLSKNLEAVVLQPHWLYVATFADGTDKVGTAADPRKWGRLTEQGAVVARYVAWAADGRVVRRLEDAATDIAGLRQAVRGSAKAAGLAGAVDLARLDRSNGEAAAHAREAIADAGDEFSDGDFHLVDEVWRPPSRSGVFSGSRTVYPLDPGAGKHGLAVRWCVGAAAGVEVAADPGVVYVADLSRLRGRRIEWGEYETVLPAMQGALF